MSKNVKKESNDKNDKGLDLKLVTINLQDDGEAIDKKKVLQFTGSLKPVRNAFAGWSQKEYEQVFEIYDSTPHPNTGLPMKYKCNAFAYVRILKEKLEESDLPAIDYVTAIAHDKDVITNELCQLDPSLYVRLGERIDPHIHVKVKFVKDGDRKVQAKTYKTASGQSNYTHPFTGKEINPLIYYTFDTKNKYDELNTLAYFTHQKNPEKALYSATEVATVNFDYYHFLKVNQNDFEAFRNKRIKKSVENDYEVLKNMVSEGVMTLAEAYVDPRWNSVIKLHEVQTLKDAEEHNSQTVMHLNKHDFYKKLFRKVNVYVVGKSGKGKSYFGNRVNEILHAKGHLDFLHGRKWMQALTAPKNPVDNYKGESVINVDDLDSSTFDADNMKAIIDNENIREGAARYKNVSFVQRATFMSSTYEPGALFPFLKGSDVRVNHEPLNQFYRRLTYVIVLVDEKNPLADLDSSRNVFESSEDYYNHKSSYTESIWDTNPFASSMKEKKQNATKCFVFPIRYVKDENYKVRIYDKDGDLVTNQILEYIPTDGQYMDIEDAYQFIAEEIIKTNSTKGEYNPNVHLPANVNKYFGLDESVLDSLPKHEKQKNPFLKDGISEGDVVKEK